MEVERVVMLHLQLASILDPEGAEISEKEL